MSTPKALIVAAALAATAGIAVPAAQAATATVRYVGPKGVDAGTCTAKKAPCKTIAYAVTQAANGNTVQVAAGHYAESVSVADKSITIAGAGTSSTVIQGSGSAPALALQGTQSSPTRVTLRNLSVSHGAGGGILGEFARVTTSGVAADHNAGFGIGLEGGSLTAQRSSFSHNTPATSAENSGLGIAAEGATVRLTSSAVDGNSIGIASGPLEVADARRASGRAATPAVVRAFGRRVAPARPDVAAATTLSVVRSSVSGNDGLGIIVQGSPTTLVNDTVANNRGAGVYVEQVAAFVTETTITGTTKYTGSLPLAGQAGIVSVTYGTNSFVPAPKQVRVAGSIDAKNSVPDCNTKAADGGYNLSSDKANSCAFGKAKHDRVRTNPKLGRLGHHGGFAGTVLPLEGSPAINAVPLKHAGCVKGATDERGVRRPQPTGGRCDIGSVELVQKTKKKH